MTIEQMQNDLDAKGFDHVTVIDKNTIEAIVDGETEVMGLKVEWLSVKTNRSMRQTMFLYQLVGDDFEKLKALEVQIKNCFVKYCPADAEGVKEVMAMMPKSNYFSLLNEDDD
jgi:hypothetical protein